MRRALTFACEGAVLAATLDDAPGTAGLLIVSGGNEIRSGAHRGMAQLAQTLAGRGWPVFRFDRRGVGDSEGENGGFRSSGPDIAAAIAAFRQACPHVTRIVAFGNCDAATALVLHRPPVDFRILANPWVVEPVDALPPPAAIRDRYARRVRDPKAWAELLTGRIDLKALAKGLGRIATPGAAAEDSLSRQVIAALHESTVPTTLVLASRDATAVAFDHEWTKAPAGGVAVERLDTASHSFSEDTDFERLLAVLEQALTGASG